MLSACVQAQVVLPLGSTESELVAALCVSLRQLSERPDLVRAEMQGGLTLTAFSLPAPAALPHLPADAPGLSEAVPGCSSEVSSTSLPADEVHAGMCIGSSADADTSGDAAQASTEGAGCEAGEVP